MAEKPIWTGAISFGLIYIPVRMYKASDNEGIDFVLVRKKDHCRIRNRRVCETTGEVVPADQIVRGYEYDQGRYIVVEAEDFRRANVRKTQVIEILGFVQENEVDPKFIERPYYLEPDLQAEKGYALLREALKESGKVAIARYVLRTREHLAMLKAEDMVILLNQMRFASEIRPVDGLSLPKKQDVSPREIRMAVKLVDLLSGPWAPEKYHDTYIEDLKALIQQKIEGKAIEEKEEAISFEVSNLFARLNESLELARQGDGRGSG